SIAQARRAVDAPSGRQYSGVTLGRSAPATVVWLRTAARGVSFEARSRTGVMAWRARAACGLPARREMGGHDGALYPLRQSPGDRRLAPRRLPVQLAARAALERATGGAGRRARGEQRAYSRCYGDHRDHRVAKPLRRQRLAALRHLVRGARLPGPLRSEERRLRARAGRELGGRDAHVVDLPPAPRRAL